MKRSIWLLFILLIGCSPVADPEPVAQAETATTAPTATQLPTNTPDPTSTPTVAPAETAVVVETAVSTTTPQPTITPSPTPKPEGDLLFDFTIQRGRDNPSLTNPSRGWDAAWTFAPGVLYHDGQFHMFFTGWGVGGEIRIGHAISDNGLDFERTSDDYILDYQPDDYTVGVWTPTPVILADSTWALFMGKNREGRLTNEILRATAPDPQGPWTWDDEPIYTTTSSAWDAALLPESIAKTPDGGYILAYENSWCTDSQIGLLYSDDGQTWTPHNNPDTNDDGFSRSDPVLQPTNNEADWDRQALSSPLIFSTEDGYELFYLGQYRNYGSKMSLFDYIWLGYATSSDGVTWERYEANPVIEVTGERGCPWMTGVKVDDTYYFYMALKAGDIGIGVITGTITAKEE